MPFLGKQPTAGFASIVKDDLTADGSTTAFTLSKNVASANDIAVFVGNVRQEPTDAYTVSGTTLTMSAAPSAAINFYVLHIAGTVESSVVPADGTISGAKLSDNFNYDSGTLYLDSTNNTVGIGTSSPSTSHKLTLDHTSNYGGISLKQSGTQVGQIIQEGGTGNVYVDADSGSLGGGLIFRTTGGTTRMNIDGSGRVTKPNQPAFSTYGTIGNVNFQAEATITAWNTMIFNEGNHFDTSTGKFTAPVNGKYFFRAQLYMQNSTGVCRFRLYKNTSVAVYHYYGVNMTPGPANIQGFLNLAANDTVELRFNADNATNVYFADNHSNFDGWLVL